MFPPLCSTLSPPPGTARKPWRACTGCCKVWSPLPPTLNLPSLPRHGKEALARMYRVLQGEEPAPENITPQCVLDALVAQGLGPANPGYARQRIALMKASVGSRVVVWAGRLCGSLHSMSP